MAHPRPRGGARALLLAVALATLLLLAAAPGAAAKKADIDYKWHAGARATFYGAQRLRLSRV